MCFLKFYLENFWYVNNTFFVLYRVFIDGRKNLNKTILARVFRQNDLTFKGYLKEAYLDAFVLFQRGRDSVDMCNIRLEVKNCRLVRLYLLVLLILSHLLNNPVAKLFLCLLFELLLKLVLFFLWFILIILARLQKSRL